MAFSLSWLCVLLCLLSLNDAWLFTSCGSKRTCKSCASSKNWLGRPCVWCPRDKKCHTDLSSNPCSISQEDVVGNATECDNIIIPVYDKSLAFKMMHLSALAYADNVASYISKVPEVNSFQVVRQVTKPCERKASCSGFVAVSQTEKAIAVVFRGSQHECQVVVEALQSLIPKVDFQTGGKVHAYFNDAFHLIWNELKIDVYAQISKNSNYKVWVTGHSLGGALASLASTVLSHEGRSPKNDTFLYTFGQPRVGNYDYASRHDKLVPISFRVTHYRDPVVRLPICDPFPGLFCLSTPNGYYHHGKEIYYGDEVMTKDSLFKKCEGLPHNEDPKCSNNLQVWFKCFSDISGCIDDHNVYFGIHVVAING